MDTVRTCIGCRMRAERSSLMRIVCRGGEIVVDEKASLPGRGAWLHPTTTCFERAVKRKAFGRALRVGIALDTRTLENRLNG